MKEPATLCCRAVTRATGRCTVTVFESHAHYDDWRVTHETGLKAACRAGNLRGQAIKCCSLGSLYVFERHNDDALRQLTMAHEQFRKLGIGTGCPRAAQPCLPERGERQSRTHASPVGGNTSHSRRAWRPDRGSPCHAEHGPGPS
jgi:hypothetical protein